MLIWYLLSLSHLPYSASTLETLVTKGQLISEWPFDVLNFQTNSKIWWISTLESKKLLNHKDKGTLS